MTTNNSMDSLTREEYYSPAGEEIFNDIKQAAIKIWRGYDDTHGYASGKVGEIEKLSDVRDNWAYIVAMFDIKNQLKLISLVEREDTREKLLRLLRRQ